MFAGFITECISKRYAAGKSTLEGLFWKEISNSTYGKLAQGLKERRIYDLREAEMQPLPPSKITNGAYAAFTTSFTRAVLGDLMNAIPSHRMVFSCTTDGFITNTNDMEMAECTKRVFPRMYSELRNNLTDSQELLEKKHVIAKPLGWRTRGQATLRAGNSEGIKRIVLAKAGISTPSELEEVDDQNDAIVSLFLKRQPDSSFPVQGLTGLRDMVEHDVDLLTIVREKRLNMEYDWKRRPSGLTLSQGYNHIAFSTSPWESISEYNFVRALWSGYIKDEVMCLKSKQDFNKWADFLYIQSLVQGGTDMKYLRKSDGDLNRLRLALCSAFKHEAAGLKFPAKLKVTNQDFADTLHTLGIKCSKANVENGKKQEFSPHTCIPTERVMVALERLKRLLPSLKVDMFLYRAPKGSRAIDLTSLPSNQFLERVD
jgi:hypothetical protein